VAQIQLSTDQTSCVEIAFPTEAPAVGIRDSKNPAGGMLLAGFPAWEAIRRSVRAT
jgi:hypothetical protein